MLLNFNNLKVKYNINITGIIHVGAHYGEELNDYVNSGVNKILLFEPIQDNYNILSEKIKTIPASIELHQVALGSEEKNSIMYVSDNEKQSSSILKPKVHLTHHPDVYFPDLEEVKVDLMDNYNTSSYNFICMDVQGYELEVLKGAEETLNHIDYVYCEVNRDELYEGNAYVEEIDLYLFQYGFERVETDWGGGLWGDAFYIKKIKISDSCQISNLESIYKEYFGSRFKGTFVEVGAYDGESFSNTSFLADIGWEGLYIEPVFEYYAKCVDRHRNNNVKVINCSIGSIEQEVNFYKGGALSTSNKDHLNAFNQIEWSKSQIFSEIKCKQYRLESILNQNKILPFFDLLVVDVEGSEEDIFNSFDLNYWKPKMIIVELIDHHEDFKLYSDCVNSHKKIRNNILNSNYMELHRDQINTIFISNGE